MWLLGIAVIIIAAAVILNFFVKWLNRRRKRRLQADRDNARDRNIKGYDAPLGENE